MASQYDNETIQRRLRFIACHLGAHESGHATSSINPIECSASSRRRDSTLLFARQSSQTYSHFMRQESVQCDSPAEEAPLFARVPLSGEKPNDTSSVNHHTHLEVSTRKCPEWVPLMDVLESGTEHVLLVALPGVSVEGIQVEVDHGRLIITGTRSVEWWKISGSDLVTSTAAEDAFYHQRDLAYGPYRTVWLLPENVDMNAISAEFVNGVLTVLIPKLKLTTSF
ncbi:hypothetical protein O6H91_06G095300 [Diphasiastrum complanatum]|uniref:Uncharacterized protein n=2 Tax=Diphasiastrum complanatum TaxID=34168 RepID=A0ACC2DG99_DIPCM|nr:hypothetical protein O6H91_06G094900 [Diphasiastrum complanatum]KAJ7553363.1 hypothetical protein O6H91_06G095300 [Diphasiastrum complanatum]